MSWRYGTYACGHEGRIQANSGNSRDKDNYAEYRFSFDCPACTAKKDFEQQNKKAGELGISELQNASSEKALHYATEIRAEIIDTFQREKNKFFSFLETVSEKTYESRVYPFNLTVLLRFKDLELSKEEITEIFLNAMKENVEADYWFTVKEAINADKCFCWLYRFCADYKAATLVPEEVEEALNEFLVAPEEQKQAGVVEVCKELSHKGIGFKFRYCKTFIDIMHEKNCKWNSAENLWYFPVTSRSGDVDDRVAEIGSKLIDNGFTVQFQNTAQLEKVRSGSWKEEYPRWIDVSADGKKLYIFYSEDDLYKQIKHLESATWIRSKGAWRVKIDFYREVAEFAETYEFHYTEAAVKAIAKYKAKLDAIPKIATGEHTGGENVISVEEINEKKKKARRDEVIIEDLLDA